MRWTNTLLVALCTGSLTASGIVMHHWQHLSAQLNRLDVLVSELHMSSKNLITTQSCEAQTIPVQQEMVALRRALEDLAIAPMNAGSASDTLPAANVLEEHYVKQEQLNQLVSEATASGFWSHADAEAFQNHSLELPAPISQAIAAQIIQRLENGTLQMPDNLLTPF